ncbi:MAG: cyclic pyranopterin monophosphate synthase MoaC [Gemmatimonadetes bacterium]|nr:MAG: cyclic pyranopterin monophosphate synthase MoaC [Gemmatimonadota bacterium]
MSDETPRDPGGLTHLDAEGRPRMVDVSDKAVTHRLAVAEGHITMASETLDAILRGGSPKGDVAQVARLAGVMGGKRTADLIPLCHTLPGVSFDVEVEPDASLPGLRVRATARVAGQTGVEMEALTAATVALLTVYDMAKAIDRRMVIGGVRLLRKEGGRSGVWSAE